jgi:hypothetical protein
LQATNYLVACEGFFMSKEHTNRVLQSSSGSYDDGAYDEIDPCLRAITGTPDFWKRVEEVWPGFGSKMPSCGMTDAGVFNSDGDSTKTVFL